jgi:glycosyltransferase involved in cell wall biosynthesis
MKLGVDLCDLSPDFVGGVNTFALGLVHGLIATREPGEQLVLLVTDRNEALLRGIFGGLDVTFLNTPVGRWRARMDTLLFKASWLTREYRLRAWYDRTFRAAIMRRIDDAIDAYVAPMTLLQWYGVRAPALLSIHDIQQEYHPEFFSWRDHIRRWAPYRASAWRAAVVQASSRYIKECLIEKFLFLKPDKVVVIPEGVDLGRFSIEGPDEMPPALTALRSGGFVFYPAQLWAHKNHLMLMDALALYRDETGVEMPCVMTGRDYGLWPDIRARLEKHGLKQVHYLGRVSFEQLLWLYRKCLATLALGLHESSSLPLREGAVFGKPLICLDIPPNREAAEHFHVRLVDRTNPRDLADALRALAENRGDVLNVAGENARLARDFDWKDIASEYRRILKEMVRQRTG